MSDDYYPDVALGQQPACVESFQSQQDFLDLFDRILPEDYLAAMKTNLGPGYELLQARAMAASRIAQAVARLNCNAFITTAHGGSYATVTVLFSRATTAAGAVTVLTGTVVTASDTGRDFVTTQDAIFGVNDLGPISAPAQAVYQSYQWNVLGQRLTATGVVIPGEIDTITLPLQSPPYQDPSITVSQVVDATGGVSAVLDQHGADRDILRTANEGDQQYRSRIRTLPDVVTPDAIVRQITNFMRPFVPGGFNAASAMIETWQITYQTCLFDDPRNANEPLPGAISQAAGFNPNLFAYDDPRPTVPFCNRWLGEEDYRGAFILVAPQLPAIQDWGLAYDDTAEKAADLVTTIGQRGLGAYDVTSSQTPTELPAFYDGYDTGARNLFVNLYNLLQSIKAGGVTAVIELAGQ